MLKKMLKFSPRFCFFLAESGVIISSCHHYKMSQKYRLLNVSDVRVVRSRCDDSSKEKTKTKTGIKKNVWGLKTENGIIPGVQNWLELWRKGKWTLETKSSRTSVGFNESFRTLSISNPAPSSQVFFIYIFKLFQRQRNT